MVLLDQLGESKEMMRESVFCKKSCSGERDSGFIVYSGIAKIWRQESTRALIYYCVNSDLV